VKQIIIILILFSFQLHSQEQTRGLVLGNVNKLCFQDSTLEISDTLPASLDSFSTLFFFSNSTSNLSAGHIDQIEQFLINGGGLYTGSDNWPLQAEANQITKEFYQKESFGNYEVDVAQVNQVGNLKLTEADTVPAGKTTSAFPLDYRLTVEAWVDDQPLILTGKYGAGKIVIDTGYSRFYCDQRNEHTDLLFKKIYGFLREEEEVKLR